jgi:DNA modification methylase
MTHLLNADCIDEMKNLGDNSIDLIFADLPYGQTSCKWDCLIDLDLWWKEVMRIKKINTPIIMTCTTKFGVNLINSAPKKCPFRYDLVWCKTSPCGFLSAKKMPMRKHEMIYVFYEKLPLYDLSSHKHKFIKEVVVNKNADTSGEKLDLYGMVGGKKALELGYKNKKYEPPLPTSLIQENKNVKTAYGESTHYSYPQQKNGESIYDPPLPNSLVKEKDIITEMIVDAPEGNVYRDDLKITTHYKDANGKRIATPDPHYDPALPTSLLEVKSTRGKHSTEKPVALMEWILKYYSKENDIILDPTMGSGSMGVACINMKRNFIGIEKDEDIFTNAWIRLNPE